MRVQLCGPFAVRRMATAFWVQARLVMGNLGTFLGSCWNIQFGKPLLGNVQLSRTGDRAQNPLGILSAMGMLRQL